MCVHQDDEQPHNSSSSNSSSIFFARFPPVVTHEELMALFSAIGEVVHINLFKRFAAARHSKGCGIVTFSKPDAAAAAMEALNGVCLFEPDAAIVVEPCNPQLVAAAGSKSKHKAKQGASGAAAAVQPSSAQRTLAPPSAIAVVRTATGKQAAPFPNSLLAPQQLPEPPPPASTRAQQSARTLLPVARTLLPVTLQQTSPMDASPPLLSLMPHVQACKDAGASKAFEQTSFYSVMDLGSAALQPLDPTLHFVSSSSSGASSSSAPAWSSSSGTSTAAGCASSSASSPSGNSDCCLTTRSQLQAAVLGSAVASCVPAAQLAEGLLVLEDPWLSEPAAAYQQQLQLGATCLGGGYAADAAAADLFNPISAPELAVLQQQQQQQAAPCDAGQGFTATGALIDFAALCAEPCASPPSCCNNSGVGALLAHGQLQAAGPAAPAALLAQPVVIDIPEFDIPGIASNLGCIRRLSGADARLQLSSAAGSQLSLTGSVTSVTAAMQLCLAVIQPHL